MILALNITEENPLLNLFQQINDILEGYQEESKPRSGRSRLFQDVHILKCLVYQASYRIVSFRELAWRLFHDPVAQALIGLPKVPDYAPLP